jgi:hypothetical protein
MPHHTEFSRARGVFFFVPNRLGGLLRILPRGFPIFSNDSRNEGIP